MSRNTTPADRGGPVAQASVAEPTAAALRALSASDFAAFGVNIMAYVKPVAADGIRRFSIHAADGTQLATTSDAAVAAASVRQNDMEPLSVH